MVDERDVERSCEAEHSDLLPWYVAGTLDESEAEAVASHLEECPACRAEARALSSMGDTLTSQLARSPEAERPPAYAHADRPSAHLPNYWKAASLAGAAATLLLALLLVARSPRIPDAASGPSIEQVPAVAFLPATRGDAVSRRLEGAGPWSVTLVLPSAAPAGPYRIAIERDGGGERIVEATVDPAASGRIMLLLDELGEAGRYRMTAAPIDDPAVEPYVYPFEVGEPAATR